MGSSRRRKLATYTTTRKHNREEKHQQTNTHTKVSFDHWIKDTKYGKLVLRPRDTQTVCCVPTHNNNNNTQTIILTCMSTFPVAPRWLSSSSRFLYVLCKNSPRPVCSNVLSDTAVWGWWAWYWIRLETSSLTPSKARSIEEDDDDEDISPNHRIVVVLAVVVLGRQLYMVGRCDGTVTVLLLRRVWVWLWWLSPCCLKKWQKLRRAILLL